MIDCALTKRDNFKWSVSIFHLRICSKEMVNEKNWKLVYSMQLPSSRMQSRYTSEMLKPPACRSRKSRVFPERQVLRLNPKQKHSQKSSLKRTVFKKVEKFLRQLSRVVKNKMFPHLLAVFQWTLLVMSIAFNINFAVVVTGAVANDALKVIMLFHLLIPFFSIALCLTLYRIRKEGTAERWIFGLSMITLLFSIVNISLHFVDNFVLFMKATEVAAWSLYNSIFSISMYKISVVFLLPLLGRITKIEKKPLRNDNRFMAGG